MVNYYLSHMNKCFRLAIALSALSVTPIGISVSAQASDETYAALSVRSHPMNRASAEPSTAGVLNPSAWSFDFQASLDAFGQKDIVSTENDAQSMGIMLEPQYSPVAFRHFGTLSVGPSFGIYPTGADAAGNNVTSSAFDLYSYGVKAQYQFEYWDNQWVIPYVSVNYYRLHYEFTNSTSGTVGLPGGAFGINLPLNHFDPKNGRAFHDNYGFNRASISLEGRGLRGGDANTDISGVSLYAGLRLDW